MCGIAGALATEEKPEVSRAVLGLTAALQHRGPDGEGFWIDGALSGSRVTRDEVPEQASLAFGHRRLSIVDLANGDQPMRNEDGSIWVAFNGEIYNHRELRGLLEDKGHRFATHADTEVLVHGWEEWGDGILSRLNGIFAFALADRRTGVTILARDPVGVKPLYIGTGPGLTWWASELGAARAAGLASDEVSRDALKLFLMYRFVPAPAAIFRNTWKLPPGHVAVLRRQDAGQAPVFTAYRTGIRSTATPHGRSEWREALMASLEEAVERQLMSDVPVGCLLSGGVDSTVVAMFMDRHLPYRPHTFGIGFRSQGKGSEARAAGVAANELGVPYTATWVEDDEYLKEWPDSFSQVGEPIGNSGGLLIHLLCRAVARTHKVVLSGQGADEPLGGYPRHLAERLHVLGQLAPYVSGWLAQHTMKAGAGRRLRRVLRARDRLSRYLEIFTVLEAEEADRLVIGGAPAWELGRCALERWVGDGRSEDSLNDLLRVDARMSLAEDLLVVADHFSMRASVELRVPFLDLAFLDLVERMPSRYKVSRLGERKWLYRRGAAAILPHDLARRLCGLRARIGRKQGFTTPFDRWFASGGGLLSDLETWMEPLAAGGLLEHTALSAFSRRARGSPEGMQRELLALYALSTWVRGQ